MKLLFLVAVSALAQERPTVNSFGFMTGCWEAKLGPTTTYTEYWMKPAGGTMLGMARTMRGDRTVFTEFSRIEKRGEDFYYIARIGDPKQAATPFKVVKSSATEVVFENPEHDFPQRIIYRSAPGGLFARIEGKQNGKERGEDFPLKEISCR